ncbi:MAG: tyrosine-type recombinase/integrase [Ktedonobacterales bacterium]|nr:tyrosine-type recombinase/integrase [Ktedonobacterales bacterium]
MDTEDTDRQRPMAALVPVVSAALPEIETFFRAFGPRADEVVEEGVFADYRRRKATNTLASRKLDLLAFGHFLSQAGLDGLIAAGFSAKLVEYPDGWRYITPGMVVTFREWLVHEGYNLQSVNRILSTVRTFAELAHMAGCLPDEVQQRIAHIHGYTAKEIINARQQLGVASRPRAKKPLPTIMGPDQVRQMKQRPMTLKGSRDAVLFCLLIDHGLRCSEALGVCREEVDLDAGVMRFYRPKVKVVQRHDLSLDTIAAIRAYLHLGGPTTGPLLRALRKGAHPFLRKRGDHMEWLPLSRFGALRITKRISQAVLLGEAWTEATDEDEEGAPDEVPNTSYATPHDFRHYWATNAVAGGTTLHDLMIAGGWSSLAMPQRYINEQEIANSGVKLKHR